MIKRRWAIYERLTTGSLALLGYVEAPTQEAAHRKAVEAFPLSRGGWLRVELVE